MTRQPVCPVCGEYAYEFFKLNGEIIYCDVCEKDIVCIEAYNEEEERHYDD